MEKKLYRVKVILYVMAENESEACVAATNARFDIFECAARKAVQLDPGWETAIPYNNQDYSTCAEILAGQQEVFHPNTPPAAEVRQWQSRVQVPSSYVEAQADPG
jgi:hypothetical protein